MSKLTVQAMDSAAAMEEIVSKLGPDAVILSTSKVNGKVVMEASTGTPRNQQRSLEDRKFSDIFSQKMIDTSENNSQKTINEQPPYYSGEINKLRRQLTEMQNMFSKRYWLYGTSEDSDAVVKNSCDIRRL